MTARPDAATAPPALPPGPATSPDPRVAARVGSAGLAALAATVLTALAWGSPGPPGASGGLRANAALVPSLRPRFAPRLPGSGPRGSSRAAERGRSARSLPTGCRARTGHVFRSGPSGRGRVVALSFDDGPAADTPSFLAILERKKVHATFFQIGAQVPGHGSLLRRMLRDGDAIGDHSLTHPNLAGLSAGQVRHQLAGAADAIRQAAGYRPCIMRPPYGALNAGVIRIASSEHLATVTWNVDPRDWSRPGTGAIEQRVLSGVRPGSIVIMHDGGGPREETLAALPHVISVLRRRGYRFETVPDLLRFKTVGGKPR